MKFSRQIKFRKQIKKLIFLFFIHITFFSSSTFSQNSTTLQNATTKPAIKHTPWNLIIYRPENSDLINDVRCYVKFEDAQTGEDVTYTKVKANYAWVSTPKIGHNYERSYYLSGGMSMHCLIKPGKYKITFTTPKDKTNMVKTSNKDDWTSNTFYYDTENPTKVLFVIPTANENGFYNGNWHIDYKAPKYFKFTKPLVTN